MESSFEVGTEAGAEGEAAYPLDPARCFVRVTGRRPNGFVEFTFAIGEPDVFVELILGEEAFADFCAVNHVQLLPSDASGANGISPQRDDWDWRLSDARETRFR